MRVLSLGALVAAAVVAAGASGQQVDVARLGPQTGERVPALRLVDHQGRAQTLESLAGPKGTMLVFVRSADW